MKALTNLSHKVAGWADTPIPGRGPLHPVLGLLLGLSLIGVGVGLHFAWPQLRALPKPASSVPAVASVDVVAPATSLDELERLTTAALVELRVVAPFLATHQLPVSALRVQNAIVTLELVQRELVALRRTVDQGEQP